MADELIDIINEENEVVGQSMKSEVHANGLRHRVSAVLLKNKEGKYLIPTASEIKVEAGGLYHSAAGHIPSGETYLQGAKRELWEETEIAAQAEDFKYLGTFWLEKDYVTRKEKERFEVFELEYEESMGKLQLNEEQINEQWLSKEELGSIYLNNPKKFSYPLKLSCEEIFKFTR
ncbi:MAG: NUDIX domain-containing protein [Candidatus Wildermuthbacteria bacterium]|nr:NUDIX domain-containing protein [Candidatus Wildermuthbacteria bacterium]